MGVEGEFNGFVNVIVGILIMVGLGVFFSVFLGVMIGVFLVEFVVGLAIVNGVCFVIVILSSVFLVIVGVFVYGVLVIIIK